MSYKQSIAQIVLSVVAVLLYMPGSILPLMMSLVDIIGIKKVLPTQRRSHQIATWLVLAAIYLISVYLACRMFDDCEVA